MPDQQLIATLELIKLCTVTTPGPTPSSMPIANILHYQPSKVGRMLDLTQTEITVNLTSGLALVAFHGLSSYRWVVIVGGSLTSAGTVEVFTGPTEISVASSGTASLHLPPQPYWITIENNRNRFPVRHTWIDLGSQRTEPFLRLVFSDPTNPDGFIDLGTILIHPGYIPTIPIKTKPSLGANETARITHSVSGAKHTQIQPIYRQREISMQAIGSTARDEVLSQWAALQETVGLHDPFVVITNTLPSSNYMDEIVYGELTKFTPVLMPEAWGSSEIIFDYEELK